MARTIAEFVAWLEHAPEGTTLSAAAVLEQLRDVEIRIESRAENREPRSEPTWRERLWTAPAETRLGVRDVVEATGRSAHWVYRHARGADGWSRIPHRKLDGELVFLAGELRTWLTKTEQRADAESTSAPRLRVLPAQARR